MAVKADLRIQLLANDVIVAESENPDLWRRVLGAIQNANHGDDSLEAGDSAVETFGKENKGEDSSVTTFAGELGIDVPTLEGACGPSKDAPFLHLDTKCWEAFKKNVPSRGTSSVSPIQLVGTALCLWFKFEGMDGLPTQVQARAVLKNLGVEDKNASRGIKNCSWLQSRSGGIQINPAEFSKALKVLKAFATKEPIENGA